MKRLLLTLALLSGAAAPVAAQNVVCSTAPLGDNSNRCASTAWAAKAFNCSRAMATG